MASNLYKRSDLTRRWIAKKVWVVTRGWIPDPIVSEDTTVPSDPIEQDTSTPEVLSGLVSRYKAWPNIPVGLTFGLVPAGYVLRRSAVGTDTTSGSLGATVYLLLSWYEPA